MKGYNPVFIHNLKLVVFLDKFPKKGCRELNCETCRYCHEWAEKVVEIDEDHRKEVLDIYEEVDDLMESGSSWKYFK